MPGPLDRDDVDLVAARNIVYVQGCFDCLYVTLGTVEGFCSLCCTAQYLFGHLEHATGLVLKSLGFIVLEDFHVLEEDLV